MNEFGVGNRASRYAKRGGVAAIVLGMMAAGVWRSGGAAQVAQVEAQKPSTATVATAEVARPSSVVGQRASYADVVDKVSPGVVTVRVSGRATPMPTSGLDQPDLDELRRFFGPQFRFRGPQQPRRTRGLGSGVIVSQDGYVLTNNHVIDNADQIRVETKDKRVFEAKLIGTDPETDLAVLKVEANGLPTVPLGNSDRVRVGDVVLAFGNPLNVGQTVTMGIVSAKGRSTGLGDGSFEDFLQTDAPINQGNSGGALVNLNGELVGINSQILTPSGGNVGLGFAIPVNMARNVMDQLVKGGKVQRAKLGVTIQDVTADIAKSLGLPDVNGGIVNDVEPGSPAAKAGIRQGDVIVGVDGRSVSDMNELRNAIASTKPGTTVSLKILREGRSETVQAKLDELSSSRREARGPSGSSETDSKFGMRVQPMTPELAERFELERGTRGLIVTDVDPDGEAAASGLQPGDVIQKVNGRELTSVSELRDELGKATDKPALLFVSREGSTRFITLRAPSA
jgi:serine protease Do